MKILGRYLEFYWWWEWPCFEVLSAAPWYTIYDFGILEIRVWHKIVEDGDA